MRQVPPTYFHCLRHVGCHYDAPNYIFTSSDSMIVVEFRTDFGSMLATKLYQDRPCHPQAIGN